MGTLRVDRRFTLGDYKYLTLDNSVEISDDAGVEENAAYLQLITFEIIYRRYMKLLSQLSEITTIDESIKYLYDIRNQELLKNQ